jgi:hypothetical protein
VDQKVDKACASMLKNLEWRMKKNVDAIDVETIMAKINVRIPEPKTEYDVSNQKQINRSLALIVEQLNSTFLKDLKEDTERFTWFGLG